METKFNHRDLIVDFANGNKDMEALQFIRDDPEAVEITLIDGEGFVNYVYRVKLGINSVIIKYGEDSFRLRPTQKLPLERQVVEYNCLQLMLKVQPGSAPEPYCLDRKYNIIAMADMSDWELLASQLERRHVDLQAASHLGRLLGKLHLETSQDNITKDKWQDLVDKFRQPELKQYIQKFVFLRPLREADPMNLIPASMLDDYRQYVKRFELLGQDVKVMKAFNTESCFIHGDCHDKAIFIKEGHAALIDFELGFLGHPAFNLAYPIACYMTSYILDESHASREQTFSGLTIAAFRAQIAKAIENMVAGYMEIRVDVADKEAYFSSLLSVIVAFTGAIVFAFSTFAGLDAMYKKVTEDGRAGIMHFGSKFLESREKVETLDQFMDLIFPTHPSTTK